MTGAMNEHTTFLPTDFRAQLPRFTAEARKANQALVDAIATMAARLGATPAQVALAWILGQHPWIVPIPGTTKPHRLDENIGAVDIELSAADLADIERAASAVSVQGDRYPDYLEQLTGR
ncbi:MAG: aldo/keto reductase [Vicinamibacterales bacterium]